jgi:hypothetical protein
MEQETTHGVHAATQTMIDHVKEYVHTRIEILKLTAIDKTAKVAGTLVLFATLFLLFIMVLVLASVGLALCINQMTDNSSYGFFIVAGIYLLIGVIVYAAREKVIVSNISNAVIKHLSEE